MKKLVHIFQMLVSVLGFAQFGIAQVGCTIPFACNYDPFATQDDGSCEFTSCLDFGCTDDGACNFDSEADYDDGTCVYASFPYDCNGFCVNDDDGDGLCDEFEVFGCSDLDACNYLSGVTNDDGSCFYECEGCTTPEACNYNPNATIDDGSCDYLICWDLGCTNAEACNFDVLAEIDDGSCSFPPLGECDCFGNTTDVIGECGGSCMSDLNQNGICDSEEVLGCTYGNALNFNVQASIDDGSCLFEGCTNSSFDTYSAVANVSGLCMSLPIRADFNLDGIVQLVDFTEFLVSLGQSYPGWTLTWLNNACQYLVVPPPLVQEGCTYQNAWNYDPGALLDLNTCQFLGCTDSLAINFDQLANEDDGSCYYSPCPDLNRDQTIDIQDLLDFFQLWGMSY